MRAVAGVLFVLATFAGAAAAADDLDCNNATAQQDMNLCAARDFEAADADLNAIWKQARATAKQLDADQPDDLKGAEDALIAAERGWIAYRDGECVLVGFQARGGSMEPMLVSACLADLTRKRIEELNYFVSESGQ